MNRLFPNYRLGLRGAAAAVLILAAHAAMAAATIDTPVPGFSDKYATVNGVRLHYKIGGQGTPVVLLHGHRAGPARRRRLGQAGRRLRQENHGGRHPRTGQIRQQRTGGGGRP
jgi:hypothetical protein